MLLEDVTISMMTTKFCSTICLLGLLFTSTVEAFVAKHHVTASTTMGTTTLRPTFLLTPSAVPPNLDSEVFTVIAQQPSLLVSDALGVVKNIAIAITGVIAVFAAIAILFSTFIIPAAAEQLEKQARELDPGMWQEYEQKLEPGETLAMRPDLMQELGNKVQARAIAEFEKIEQEVQSKSTSESTAPPGVVDVEVVKDEKKD